VNELVVMTEDRLVDGTQVELGKALVEETKGREVARQLEQTQSI
jgi:hypothetical protein